MESILMRLTNCLVVAAALLIPSMHVAADGPDKAPQPSEAEAEKLLVDGDRLADQSDYNGALERYTEAYHTIVSGIRGQRFSARVLPSLLTRQELGQEMLKMVEDEFTPEELALMDATFKVFGLVPPEVKSAELLTRLLTEEVAGFYDPKKKRMVLIRENGAAKEPGFFERLLGAKASFDKAEQKTTLAHEMTHALQDQLYDLQALQKRVEKDDDQSLALAALVEGDATLVMYAEMDEGSDITQTDPEIIRSTLSLMTWLLPVAGGPTMRKAPAIFRDSLIFPYFQGLVFCLSIAGKDGWEGVHAAYADPPASTEQILHPEKYNRPERDEPQAVTLPPLDGAVGKRWQHVGGNCLGEFQTRVMLKQVKSGGEAAAGWDGDRYEVFRRTGGELAIVFVSVWDSQQDAEQFAKAYAEYRQAVPAPHGKGADHIAAHGDQVWVIEGFSKRETGKIAQQLEKTSFEPKPFPMP
jgi:hypothetical protein